MALRTHSTARTRPHDTQAAAPQGARRPWPMEHVRASGAGAMLGTRTVHREIQLPDTFDRAPSQGARSCEQLDVLGDGDALPGITSPSEPTVCSPVRLPGDPAAPTSPGHLGVRPAGGPRPGL